MSPELDTLIGALDAEVPAAMEDLRIPGAAVGICDASGVLWAAGYGTTARGGGTPVTPRTAFSAQSTSKLYTAVLTLLLASRGQVDLDAPIRAHLPEFSVNSVFDEDPGEMITLRHLLAHTAGLCHDAPLGSNYDPGNGNFDDHCRSIFETWLRFPVGHHHEYSNLGIDLAGFALERVAGVPFAELARRELLAPLGLERSSFEDAAIEADADRAIGHWRSFEEAGVPAPVTVPMVAAGGLYTSVEDALRFVSFLLGGGQPLLDPQLAAEQLRVQFPLPGQELGYGLGVYVDEWEPGVRVFHHGGSGFGFQGQLCWAPELGLGAVALTNSFEQSLPFDLARSIVARVAGGERTPPPQPSPAAGGDGGELGAAGELVGEYVGRLGPPLRVLVEGGRLLVRGEETRPARLLDPQTLELGGGERERFRFDPGPAGAATYMLELREGTARYRNEAAWGASSTLDPAAAGTYVADAWGVPVASYRLAQQGEAPVIEPVPGEFTGPEPVSLRLAPIEAGLFLSSTGEVLDLRGPVPSYSNVALRREEERG